MYKFKIHIINYSYYLYYRINRSIFNDILIYNDKYCVYIWYNKSTFSMIYLQSLTDTFI